jgi:hypothetical protein
MLGQAYQQKPFINSSVSHFCENPSASMDERILGEIAPDDYTRGRVLWCITRPDLFAPPLAQAGLARSRDLCQGGRRDIGPHLFRGRLAARRLGVINLIKRRTGHMSTERPPPSAIKL